MSAVWAYVSLYIFVCSRVLQVDGLHEAEDTIGKKFRAVLSQSLVTPGGAQLMLLGESKISLFSIKIICWTL